MREKAGPPPPSLGLHFPGTGICGSHVDTQPGQKPKPTVSSARPCRSRAAGLCAQTPTPRGSLAAQATAVPRTLVSGAVPGAWPQHSSHASRRSAGARERKRQAPRRPLSCPPSQTVNTAVLSGFPSALPALLRPILESEPRHITPAALLRCPSEKGPAQCLRSLSGLTLQPPHPTAAHCPGGLPSVCTDDKAFRQTWFSPAPGARRGAGSACSLHTTGRPPALATDASHALTAPTHPPRFPCSDGPGKTWSPATIPKGQLTVSDVTEESTAWLRDPGAGLHTAPGDPQQREVGPHLEHETLAAGGVQHRLQGEVAEAHVVGPALGHLGEEAADALVGCS